MLISPKRKGSWRVCEKDDGKKLSFIERTYALGTCKKEITFNFNVDQRQILLIPTGPSLRRHAKMSW